MRRVGGRAVTIVVCDAGGRLLGSFGPFEVATPWWQDVEPIRRRFPALSVVRLLHGTPVDRGAVGGQVTYLAEGDPGLALSPAAELAGPGVLADHPLRMPWARPKFADSCS